ncbi:MAG: hypothetical protein JXA42_14775 [Anaerolineales bacterium]|nr:hypothetical protein [Anaerolineales bacterium]
MRLVLMFLLIPIVLFGVALSLMWIPLPAPLPPVSSSGRNLMAAICTGLVGLVFLVGFAVYTIDFFRQAVHKLDNAFRPPLYSSQSYMGVGRQYRGTEQGRRVEVNYIPAARLQPALLNIYIDAGSGTSAAIGKERPLLDCRDCPLVEHLSSDLDGLEIYAADPEWMRSYLDDPSTRNAVIRLMEGKERGFRELYIQPDRIWLRSHPRYNVSAEQVRRWCDDLLALAKAAEREMQ